MRSGSLLRALIYISDFFKWGLHSVTKSERKSASPVLMMPSCLVPMHRAGIKGMCLRRFLTHSRIQGREWKVIKVICSQSEIPKRSKETDSQSRKGLSELLNLSVPSGGTVPSPGQLPWEPTTALGLRKHTTVLACTSDSLPQEEYSFGEKILNDLN